MKKNVILAAFGLALCSLSANAQSTLDAYWQHVEEKSESVNEEKLPVSTWLLQEEVIRAQLSAAPLEVTTRVRDGIEIYLPTPQGSLERFRVVESSVMAPELQAMHPELRQYLAQGVDTPWAVSRFDISPSGFHASVRSGGDAWIVQPSVDDRGMYVVEMSGVGAGSNPFTCGVEDTDEDLQDVLPHDDQPTLVVGDGVRHEYRLAVASTGEYTAERGGTSEAIAFIVSLVNSMNLVFENDIATRFYLIANNDQLIYDNASTDPFPTVSPPSEIYAQGTTIFDSLIGNSNYDIGIIMFVAVSGPSGKADIGALCYPSAKGNIAIASPYIGGPLQEYNMGTMMHEVGHAIGGTHTWSGSLCGGQSGSSYEPGGGYSIMSYRGRCDPIGLDGSSQWYFHFHSIGRMNLLTFSDPTNCSVQIPTGNTAPVVSANNDIRIPRGTPFQLVASGSDADVEDANSLTYCWEQADAFHQSIPQGDTGQGPITRSLAPVPQNYRYYLPLPRLVAGTTARGERLPTVVLSPATERIMHFRVTVRDNRAGGGRTSTDEMLLIIPADSQAFTVSQPPASTTVYSGSPLQVTWDVGTSASSPINATTVDILLSTNGGQSFDVVLASGTANDGSEVVVPNFGFPSILTGRIMVKATIGSHSFFNLNPGNFTLQPACDSIDFNNDLSLFDSQDIDAFLSVFNEGPCIPSTATCNDIDFNNDGSIFDPCDIDAFLLVYSEGPCTPCGS